MIGEPELWELAGPYWKLPLKVIRLGSMAEVRSGFGVRLTPKMISQAEAALDRYGEKNGSTHYMLTEELVALGAVLSSCSDPEDVLEWLPAKQEKIPEVKGVPEFIHKYCESGYSVIRDPQVADIVWGSFCKWMLHWFVNRTEPIDLGFAKIIPLPMRRNWANTAIRFEQKQNRKGLIKKKDFLSTSQASMKRRGMTEFFCSSDVTSVRENGPGYIRWILEIITGETFESMMKKKMIQALSTENIYRDLKAKLPLILDAYENYLKEVRHPCRTVDLGNFIGREGPYPRKHLNSVRRSKSPEAGIDRPVVRNRHASEDTVSAVVPADETLPSVSFVQPAAEDVRNGWDANDRSGDG